MKTWVLYRKADTFSEPESVLMEVSWEKETDNSEVGPYKERGKGEEIAPWVTLKRRDLGGKCQDLLLQVICVQ